MRFCAFLVLTASLALTIGCGKKDGGSASGDQDKFQGVWKVVDFDFGEPGQGPPKEMIEKMRLAFKGDKMYFFESAEEFEPASYILDVKQDPHHLSTTKLDDKGEPKKSMEFKEGKMIEGPPKSDQGIYKFDGDKLVVAMGGKDNRPKEFKAIAWKKPEPGKEPDFNQPTVTVVTLVKTNEAVPEFKKKEKPKVAPLDPSLVPPLPKDAPTPKLPEVPAPKLPEPPSK